MPVRHLVSKDNVDPDGRIIDASKVCHGAIRFGLVESVSGSIDPLTHLNLDFEDHQLGEAIVVLETKPGSLVVRESDGTFARALARIDSFASLGGVDIDQRRVDWLRSFERRREERT